MNEPKPCPFCGSEELLIEEDETSCLCILSDGWVENEIWNTRPIEDKQAEQIERLKELCQKARDHCSFGLYAEGSLVRKNNVQEALRLLEQALAATPQEGQDNDADSTQTG